jgi:hypothetical protein
LQDEDFENKNTPVDIENITTGEREYKITIDGKEYKTKTVTNE